MRGGHDQPERQERRGTDDVVASLEDVIHEALPEVAAGIGQNLPVDLTPAVRYDAKRRETEIGVLAMQIALLVQNCVYMGCPMAGELDNLAGRLILVILARGADGP
jgi:hypothetical protein